MKNNRIAALRERLERLPTQQLEEILHDELKKDPADGDAARLILRILEERDAGCPVEYTPEIESAWNNYLKYDTARTPRHGGTQRWVMRAASIAAIVCLLLLAIPREVEAEGLFQRLIRWTDSIFELFSPDEALESHEYRFETDNPDLQQIYEAVTELGVVVPVVPMWIPEGYELVEYKTTNTPAAKGMMAEFSTDSQSLIIKLDVYSHNVSNAYQKDKTVVKTVEIANADHNIMRNEDAWMVVWTRNNIECSIFVDCQEDVLHKILTSIYTMEEE